MSQVSRRVMFPPFTGGGHAAKPDRAARRSSSASRRCMARRKGTGGSGPTSSAKPSPRTAVGPGEEHRGGEAGPRPPLPRRRRPRLPDVRRVYDSGLPDTVRRCRRGTAARRSRAPTPLHLRRAQYPSPDPTSLRGHHPLADIVESKAAAGRPQDLAALPIWPHFAPPWPSRLCRGSQRQMLSCPGRRSMTATGSIPECCGQ